MSEPSDTTADELADDLEDGTFDADELDAEPSSWDEGADDEL
jgi:hypothetical protein